MRTSSSFARNVASVSVVWFLHLSISSTSVKLLADVLSLRDSTRRISSSSRALRLLDVNTSTDFPAYDSFITKRIVHALANVLIFTEKRNGQDSNRCQFLRIIRFRAGYLVDDHSVTLRGFLDPVRHRFSRL